MAFIGGPGPVICFGLLKRLGSWIFVIKLVLSACFPVPWKNILAFLVLLLEFLFLGGT